MIDLLTRQIAELDRAIARLIEEDQTLSSQARLLSAVPGVGPTVLATLLGELPELGTLDRRASRRSLASHRTPERAEHGAVHAGSRAAVARSTRRSTSPPLPPHDASPASSPCAIGCVRRARRRRLSSSPSHAGSSSSSMPCCATVPLSPHKVTAQSCTLVERARRLIDPRVICALCRGAT